VTITRINIAVGLSLPLFPGRPMNGLALRTADQAQAQFERDMDLGKLLQPKLGGDRAVLGVTPAALHICNRHGGWLHQGIKNRGLLQELQSGTVLDGEVIDGHFYPFECLADGGTSLVAHPTEWRITCARTLCARIGVQWLFAPPTLAYIRKMRANLPRWEGYVAKSNLPYPLGRSASEETTRWTKHRW
jgi:hypothetical protein